MPADWSGGSLERRLALVILSLGASPSLDFAAER